MPETTTAGTKKAPAAKKKTTAKPKATKPKAAKSGKPQPPAEPKPGPKPRMAKLADLRLDGGTQMRPFLDDPTLKRYEEAYREGEYLPPIDVIQEGDILWLWDGFQRHKAAERAGLSELPAIIRKGTLDDAIKRALSANASHGLPRNPETIKRSVYAAIEHGWGGSINEIKRLCKISWDAAKNWSDRYAKEHPEIAERKPEANGKITVQRGGQSYEMDTKGIASSRAAKTQAAANGSPSPPSESPSQEAHPSREPGQDDESAREAADAAYLRTIPFRDLLKPGETPEEMGPRDVFDEEALIYRDCEELIEQLKRRALKGKGVAGKKWGPFRRAVQAFVTRATPPQGYVKCLTCVDGKVDGRPCTDCNSLTFVAGESGGKGRGK